MTCIPLFPVHAVLFPGGLLPLKIFEQRYLELVARSLRDGTGFAVCLIREGREVNDVPLVHGTGTLVHIDDWGPRPDGLLGITVRGDRRVRIHRTEVRRDGLMVGEVDVLEREPPRALPPEYQGLAELLEHLVCGLGPPLDRLAIHYTLAGDVADRLAELLPLALEEKQGLLEMDDPCDRLEALRRGMQALRLAS